MNFWGVDAEDAYFVVFLQNLSIEVKNFFEILQDLLRFFEYGFFSFVID